MRYAANRPAVAARERFAARTISDADGQHWLVRFTLSERVLALTHQANLDTLGLDDRVSTGRIDVSGRIDPDPLLDTCGHLGDAVYDWWNGSPPPLLYRSRTTPGVGRNIAFTHTARWSVIAARPLRQERRLVAAHPSDLNRILNEGDTRTRDVATNTLKPCPPGARHDLRVCA